MTRKLALVAGVLLSSLTAGSLLAQTSAPAKPAPKSSMQHAPAAAPANPSSQDTTMARSGAAKHAAWTADQVKEAQQGLAKGGFYKGKVTGVMDRQTHKAIRAYQKANKLPVTGKLNTELLDKLHSA